MVYLNKRHINTFLHYSSTLVRMLSSSTTKLVADNNQLHNIIALQPQLGITI